MKTEYASERSIILYHTDPPNRKTSAELSYLRTSLKRALGSALVDQIQSYQSLLVIFDPLQTNHQTVTDKLTQLIDSMPEATARTDGELVRLPVYYHEEVGPDLERIAKAHTLSIKEVIQRHCADIYRVYAIGFAPGFAYLGEVDDSIAMARLASPRAKVAKGSVGIADRQTAIYPAASPAGWNIIGRCPCELFDPEAKTTMPFKVGDSVQFLPINREEFLYLGGEL